MNKPTTEVRHEIYEYLIGRGFSLTHEDRVFLSTKIQEHSNNRADNLKEISAQHAFAIRKILKYVEKAKTLPASPILKAQVDTLRLVQGWLNTQPEDRTE